MGTCKIDLMNNPMRLYQSAIISYDARDQALAAMDKFRQEKVFDKYLMILGYETDRTKLFSNEGNVFIKGIPKAYDFQMDKFYKRMREIGEIYSFKVGLNSEGKATGYAFVKFKNPQDAIKLEEQGEIKFIEDKLTV